MTGPIVNPRCYDGESHLNGSNAAYIEALYESYLQDPNSVEASWRNYFLALDQQATASPGLADNAESNWDATAARKQASVLRLINAYRVRGHQSADIDPLDLWHRDPVPDLDLAYHDLGEADLDTEFNTGSLFAPDRMPLREIHRLLKEVYTGCIGSEYMYLTDTQEKRWVQARLEGCRGRPKYSVEKKRRILQRLTAAEGIEKYLHTKYVGQKRFSLEGGESLIPLLDELIQRGGERQIKEMVLAMAHRGRLNVLVNIVGKSPAELFSEFEGRYDPQRQHSSGDVKYHQGFSSDVQTPGGSVHIALAFNPSHLEISSPVVQGSVKARQVRRQDLAREQVLAVLIHGDAAIAGQGVVMETLNMSQARGFRTGGTVHVVINNQIGFTTSNPIDARSTYYCTEVAKMVQAPIFHVNGDDPEAVAFTTRLALDFRMEFKKDVVIDMICYRRHGHNEADEPTVTQPIMYRAIKSHSTVRKLYAESLVREELIQADEAEQMATQFRDALDRGEAVHGDIVSDVKNPYAVDWSPYRNQGWTTQVDTTVSLKRLRHLNSRLQKLPEGFHLHDRVKKIMANRDRMAQGELPLDWGFAETMAYASLNEDGYFVRLSGQDSGRGTFFHRHAILHDQDSRETYVPLRHVLDNDKRFLVINSLLSEEAVLAFEYGYSTADPETLVIWEAQFGDFANGAQVVIDQFIASGESKWGRLCGLTLFLPHGYEGQGPEHSSARLERYLQLCAEQNMQVCMPSTSAQMFHLLRRQMIRPFRHPLVILTPKSLLRHKLATSSIDQLASGGFELLIGEQEAIEPERVQRVVACCGKVYYDLIEERQSRQEKRVALMRIEQLYPFPDQLFAQELARYPNARELVWCQDEPRNQGAWYQIEHRLREALGTNLTLAYAGRPNSPSPAVGYYNLHVEQQSQLLDQALTVTAQVQALPRKTSHGH